MSTSQLALASVDIPRGQAVVLAALRTWGPCTDEQLVQHLAHMPMSPSGVRSRRAELVARGLVAETGRTVPGRTGRQMTVWTVLSEGEQRSLWGDR